jgi:hypothetical protein
MLIDVSSNVEFEELASRLSEILLLRVASEKTTSEPSCSLQSEAGQVLSSPVKYSDTLIAENMATHVNDRVLEQVL